MKRDFSHWLVLGSVFSLCSLGCLDFKAVCGSVEEGPLDCECLTDEVGTRPPVVVGVVAPRTFATSNDGEEISIPHVDRWLDGIELARTEWREALGMRGLPGSGRPLSVVKCNSRDRPFNARRAMGHLVEDLEASVVLALSDRDTQAIVGLAERNGVPVVCSTCYDQQSTNASSGVPIWPAVPALRELAPSVARQAVEQALERAEGTPPRVVALVQDYPGIREFAEALAFELTSQAELTQISPSAGDNNHGFWARMVADAQPHVVISGFDSDFTTYYLAQIEDAWPEGEPKPAYVLSYMNQEETLLGPVVGADDDLLRRITGVGWHRTEEVEWNFNRLGERFARESGKPLDQVHFGYDAFYAAAYAIAWAGMRGYDPSAGVSEGFDHLLAGQNVNTDPSSIRNALTTFPGDNNINLTGTATDLDWDRETHALTSNAIPWCLTRDAESNVRIINAQGPVWRARAREFEGSYSCPD